MKPTTVVLAEMRIAFAGLGIVLLCAVSGCQRHSELAALSPEQGRRVEVLIRSQHDVPADYRLMLGRRTRSEFPGYYDLPVRFSHNGKEVALNFLLSQDGKRLGRLQESDLTSEPWRAIHVATNQAQGAPDAKVTIVVFDDLACSFCAQLYAELIPEALKRYKGAVRIAYKDYPLPIHPWALHAAVDAACVAQQSTAAYWDYIGKVHARPDDFSGEAQRLPASFNKLDQIASQETGVDQRILGQCIKQQDDRDIRGSMAEGEMVGVQNTPTIFVNGEKLVGAPPVEWLWAAIDRALESQGLVPPGQ